MGKESPAVKAKAAPKAKGKQSDIASFFGGKPKAAAKPKDGNGDIKSFFGGSGGDKTEKAAAPKCTKAAKAGKGGGDDDADDIMEVEEVDSGASSGGENAKKDSSPKRAKASVGEGGSDDVMEVEEVGSDGDGEKVEVNGKKAEVNGGGVVRRAKKRRKVIESDDEDDDDDGAVVVAVEDDDGKRSSCDSAGVEGGAKEAVAVEDVAGEGKGKDGADVEAKNAAGGDEEDAQVEEAEVQGVDDDVSGEEADAPEELEGSDESEEEEVAPVKRKPAPAARKRPSAPKKEDDVSSEESDEPQESKESDESESEEEEAATVKRKPAPEVRKRPSAPKKGESAVSLNFDEAPSWKEGAPVPYKFLAESFGKIEAISGRLEITAILTDVFRKVIETTPADLLPTVYLCSNKLAAAHEGIESGVGETVLIKALSQSSGTKPAALRAKFKKVGDLGDVAAEARSSQTTMFPPPPLLVHGVFKEMRAIAESHGKSAVEGKTRRILKLMVSATSKNEARYLARALQGKLRIQLAVKTVVAALANAVTLGKLGHDTGVLLSSDGKKKAKLSAKEEKIETALKKSALLLSAIYNQRPVWEDMIPALLAEGEVNEKLAEKCKFTPGIPISPMLAKPTKAIADVLETFAESKFTCEFKYDGERAQVHRLADGTVKIYSRNAEDLTPKYPDLCDALPKSLKEGFKGASFVLDGESTAYDVAKKTILPFQDLQSRKRKDVDAGDITIRVCVFAFDLLYFNGESLLLEPLSKRREVLFSSFDEVEGVFMFAKGHDSREPEEITELLDQSIREGCEGLMVKALDGDNATYEPANRSQNWLKVKKDYLAGMGDTLDLVPIGAYLGKGKRAGKFGGFLLACYDPENEEYQSICKIGTGFSDVNLDAFTGFFKGTRASCTDDEAKKEEIKGETDGDGDKADDSESKPQSRVLDGPKSYYRTGGGPTGPDVWLDACVVWEVACADLSISPLHQAARGIVHEDKGISLRFPRFLRIRDDKGVEEATDAEQVADFYNAQAGVANKK